jgi:MoxR-like ATPase
MGRPANEPVLTMQPEPDKKDWKIFKGDGSQHDGLLRRLPDPPPWRFSRAAPSLELPQSLDIHKDALRAEPFLPSGPMILAVNTALYLRRPLLLTGKAGTGKSTLIYKVAHELKLGPVIRWPISSRSTVRGGIYEYDAVGRLQAGKNAEPPVEQYLKLGPLGTALMAETWPRPLLIDEIDKSDLDFANDLLNIIEEGEYEIPELRRLGIQNPEVTDYFGNKVVVPEGRMRSGQFPFVVMTSNAEREFPPPFLRRCVRLKIDPPKRPVLEEIINSHLKLYTAVMNTNEIDRLLKTFETKQSENRDVSTDQLLNAVFLTVAMRDSERSFDDREITELRDTLLKQLSGPDA